MWSFGCLLFEIFSRGDDPFCDGDTETRSKEAKSHILEGAKLKQPEDIPDLWWYLVTSAMEKSPEARWSFEESLEWAQKLDAGLESSGDIAVSAKAMSHLFSPQDDSGNIW
jgi:Protein tyrosine and serine/threonine kinase